MAMNKFSYKDSEYKALAMIYPEIDEPNWSRDAAWGSRTPLIYRQTDPTLIPCPDATAKALSIDPQDKTFGVLLWGPTGTAKTRTAYLVARKAMDLTFEEGFATVTGRELRDSVTALARIGGVTEWIRDMIDNAGVLLLDDIGHGNASESYLSAMLELVEAATSTGCYLIVTSNYSGRDLLAQWGRSAPEGRETAAAIGRRLAEFCKPVRFARPTQRATPGRQLS